MNISRNPISDRVSKAMPDWAKTTLEVANAPCDPVSDSYCSRSTDRHVWAPIKLRLRDHLEFIAKDESDQDEAIGEIGKVKSGDRTVVYQHSAETTEFFDAQANGVDFAYGSLDSDKEGFQYLTMYRQRDEGTAYESFLSGEGPLQSPSKSLYRGYGIVKDS